MLWVRSPLNYVTSTSLLTKFMQDKNCTHTVRKFLTEGGSDVNSGHCWSIQLKYFLLKINYNHERCISEIPQLTLAIGSALTRTYPVPQHHS